MNSALQSLIPAKARRWVFIGLIILVLLVALLGFLRGKEGAFAAILTGLACLLVLAAIWFGIAFAMRGARRKKQRSFDAGMAAREGIDDRKREWKSWVAELEKNDIDRYELPFYLLVGEPQSGKSVLLQNSDLKFLFGQSRLSGIGGTRGCDWWFTEEAVILDLAGRLFTHEGGAADEAEWEAFLDLLNEFRPLDPANGIMLVIPCDGLLEDSLEVCAQKASKAREALLSLTRTLEAKLPIYVVLTKADKIFGFAETVHRLPIEQRQQMFGWSRTAERLEEPYEPTELRTAWDKIVERGTALRDRMLGSARLPEAQPEVDRMLGFPEELRGLYEPLESYLDRIFLGSDLVEQLYFRGVYLTSGLQSGAPIAKVCLDILDRPGEADNRDLEKLFIRQQAYFIKDLVRRRVFGERGLVKPTSSRVEKAKKKAWVGYGVAASIALVSLIWGGFEMYTYMQASQQPTYEAALDAAEQLTPSGLLALKQFDPETEPSVGRILTNLEKVRAARDVGETFLQEMHKSRQPDLKELYASLYDDVYRPRVQELAASKLAESTRPYGTEEGDLLPGDINVFLGEARAAAVLTRGFDSGEDAAALGTLLALPSSALEAMATQHQARKKGAPEDAPFAASDAGAPRYVGPAIGELNALWDLAFDATSPMSLTGDVGFCLNWYWMRDFEKRIASLGISVVEGEGSPAAVHGLCASATEVLDKLRETGTVPGFALDAARLREFAADASELPELRSSLLAAAGTDSEEWPVRAAFLDWLRKQGLVVGETLDSATESLLGASSSIPGEKVEPALADYVRNENLRRVIGRNWLGPNVVSDVGSLEAKLKRAFELSQGQDTTVATIAELKLLDLQRAFLAAYGAWPSYHAARYADGGGPADGDLAEAIATHDALTSLFGQLKDGPKDLGPLQARVDALRLQGVAKIGARLGSSEMSPVGVTALLEVALEGSSTGPAALAALGAHVRAVRETLQQTWSTEFGQPDRSIGARRLAKEALEHLGQVDAALGAQAGTIDSGRSAWANGVGERIAARLAEDQVKVQAEIERRSTMPEIASIDEACNWVLEDLLGTASLEKLNAWANGLPEVLDVTTPGNQDVNNFVNRYPDRTLGAWTSYTEVAGRGTWSDGSPPSRLRDYVRKFKDSSGRTVTGGDLANRYYGTELEFPEKADLLLAQRGIDIQVSQRVLDSFRAVALKQIRSDYLNDLRRSIVTQRRAELEVLWHDRETPAIDKERHDQALQALFGDRGAYLSLLDRYLAIEHRGDGVRIPYGELRKWGDELLPTQRALWTLDHFLQEMLIYVRGAKELGDLARQSRTSFALAELPDLKIYMGPRAEAQQQKDAWFAWSRFRSETLTDGVSRAIQSQGGFLEEQMEVSPWGFDRPRKFELTFLRKVQGNPEIAEPYVRSSSLDPLLFFWSDDRTRLTGDELSDQVQEANVNFRVVGDEIVPFRMKIIPLPPRRPNLDLDALGGS